MFGLPTLYVWIIGGAMLAISSFGGGFYLEGRLKESEIADMKATETKAYADALMRYSQQQQQQEKINLEAALKDAVAQAKIVTVTQTITKEIPTYVTVKADAVACIPVGLERLLYAAAASVDPATLVSPSGQSSDACSDVTASEMAGWFKDYASQSNANAQQLNDLEARVISVHDSGAKSNQKIP